MKTYCVLVKKGENSQEHGSSLTQKRYLKQSLKIEPDLVIEYEFKAPSLDVARIVSDVHTEFIEDLDKFLHDLANHYGYKLVKK